MTCATCGDENGWHRPGCLMLGPHVTLGMGTVPLPRDDDDELRDCAAEGLGAPLALDVPTQERTA